VPADRLAAKRPAQYVHVYADAPASARAYKHSDARSEPFGQITVPFSRIAKKRLLVAKKVLSDSRFPRYPATAIMRLR
jgi:hypothetical protein